MVKKIDLETIIIMVFVFSCLAMPTARADIQTPARSDATPVKELCILIGPTGKTMCLSISVSICDTILCKLPIRPPLLICSVCDR